MSFSYELIRATIKHLAASNYYGARATLFRSKTTRLHILNCVPKSGTHLINGVIEELSKQSISLLEMDDMAFNGMFYSVREHRHKFQYFPNDAFVLCHFFATEKNVELVNQFDSTPVFLYRDPRAVAVSYVNWAMKQPRTFMHKVLSQKPDFATRLDLVINGFLPSDIQDAHKFFPGIIRWYREYQPWLTFGNTLSIKFEDIVGARGGGNEDKRTDVILRLGRHLGFDVTRPYVERTFNSQTFHIDPKKSHTFKDGMGGMVDSWREHFEERHYASFASGEGADILKVFGYWDS